MRGGVFAAVLAVSGVVAGCASAGGAGARGDGRGERARPVMLRNRSGFDLAGLTVRADAADAWSAERLPRGGLGDGRDAALRGVPCRRSDLALRFVDGARCVLQGVASCGEGDGLTLTADDVLRCRGGD